MFDFLRRFRPTIDLDVGPTHFRFRDGQVEATFEPLCRFNDKGQFFAIVFPDVFES